MVPLGSNRIVVNVPHVVLDLGGSPGGGAPG
jgi:hypothetical protein